MNTLTPEREEGDLVWWVLHGHVVYKRRDSHILSVGRECALFYIYRMCGSIIFDV